MGIRVTAAEANYPGYGSTEWSACMRATDVAAVNRQVRKGLKEAALADRFIYLIYKQSYVKLTVLLNRPRWAGKSNPGYGKVIRFLITCMRSFQHAPSGSEPGGLGKAVPMRFQRTQRGEIGSSRGPSIRRRTSAA
jgi:hypothetical protein